jgi:hypothetical protein
MNTYTHHRSVELRGVTPVYGAYQVRKLLSVSHLYTMLTSDDP